ncbi:flavin reductase (plasmid) [Bradyrhizobium barranii]|uniref:Flavin reductase n=1 Tax=Bradyrhizobium barranii TaxID=2992140 RepID=A0ABY3R2S0_9BRAD|nr:flavin reductase [Bradyrhizobium japonicum]UFW92231.1 flavin reductase [Bradyrhizobium japonicum]
MLAVRRNDGESYEIETIPFDPAIDYIGTPVVLISSLNENGSSNLAPMSSAWWLGWGCMLRLNSSSKATENLLPTSQCMLNLPSEGRVDPVARLALTTRSSPVRANKLLKRFRYVEDAFGLAGLTEVVSELVAAPRAFGPPVQLECEQDAVHEFGIGNPNIRAPKKAIQVAKRLVKEAAAGRQVIIFTHSRFFHQAVMEAAQDVKVRVREESWPRKFGQ